MNAYDYDAQCWRTGEDARRLLVRQLSDELDLLRSDRGQWYLDFVRKRGQPRVLVAEAIGQAEAELAGLSEVSA